MMADRFLASLPSDVDARSDDFFGTLFEAGPHNVCAREHRKRKLCSISVRFVLEDNLGNSFELTLTSQCHNRSNNDYFFESLQALHLNRPPPLCFVVAFLIPLHDPATAGSLTRCTARGRVMNDQ